MQKVPVDLWQLYTCEDENYPLFVQSTIELAAAVHEDIARARADAMKAHK